FEGKADEMSDDEKDEEERDETGPSCGQEDRKKRSERDRPGPRDEEADAGADETKQEDNQGETDKHMDEIIAHLSLRGVITTKQSCKKISTLPLVARNDKIRVGTFIETTA